MARDGNGHWLPGASANPKGRPPKGATLTEALGEHVDKGELAAKLYELALDGNVAALKYVYDRVDGLPKQHLHVEDERDDPLRDLLIDAFGTKREAEDDSPSLGGGGSEASNFGGGGKVQ